MKSRFHYIVADTPAAHAAYTDLTRDFPNTDADQADAIIVLGGDGTMLEALHKHALSDVPLYGVNLGTVGFLMNPLEGRNLNQLINQSQKIILHPLRMKVYDLDGKVSEAIAFNEVALFRQTYQSAHISISIDHNIRLEELVCDGVLVSTPAGSTAYNLSAHGPIVPLGQPILALTPISPFRPRRWRGALLPNSATIHFNVLDAKKRPVSATADFSEFRNIQTVSVWEDQTTSVTLLFDPGNGLQDRILSEQFLA